MRTEASASGSKYVQNLHQAETFVLIGDVDGGPDGGRATIGIHYAAVNKAKLRLLVNDRDYSFVNTSATSGWQDFTGYSGLTVPLGAGKTNRIQLLGGHGGVNVIALP
ncbi:MAG: DUF5010 C-terminal domain-containing protein [Verrucomicrobiota bacterium]